MVIRLAISQHLQQRDPCHLIWQPVIKPCGMLHFKWPQRQIINPMLTPMQRCVKHESLSHVHDCLDCTLCLSVLMLSSNSRERLCLILFSTCFSELLCSKYSIITAVVLDLYHCKVINPLFKLLLRPNGFTSTHRDLILNMNDA